MNGYERGKCKVQSSKKGVIGDYAQKLLKDPFTVMHLVDHGWV